MNYYKNENESNQDNSKENEVELNENEIELNENQIILNTIEPNAIKSNDIQIE